MQNVDEHLMRARLPVAKHRESNVHENTALEKRDIYLLCGPTSSMKTAVSDVLPEHMSEAGMKDPEFINTDTMQLFPPSTLAASPSATQLARNHRLFGVRTYDQTTSRSDWQDLALDAIRDAFNKGKQPILIGGARSLIACLVEGTEEIILNANKGREPTFPREPEKPPFFPYKLNTILLLPPEETIFAAIRRRIEKNIENIIAEVRRLSEAGFALSTAVFGTIGLPEILKFLDEKKPLQQTIEKIVARTESYAQQQRAFFIELQHKLMTKSPGNIVTIYSMNKMKRIAQIMEFMRKKMM